ncbi:MAG: XdhC family protein, partial [Thermomicrobiales bacterium]
MSGAGNLHATLANAIEQRIPIAVCTIVKGEPLGTKLLVQADSTQGSLGNPALDEAVAAAARELTEDERSETRAFPSA